jgi:hypothetical protein
MAIRRNQHYVFTHPEGMGAAMDRRDAAVRADLGAHLREGDR